jgi:cobalt-zinc-cadmium efflux system outer membrane protein
MRIAAPANLLFNPNFYCMYNYVRKHWLVPVLLCIGMYSHAQTDTLSLPLREAEKRFIDSNLLLLAAHYEVDASKALADQAKVWDNPILTTDQNVFADGKFFEHRKDANGNIRGQYFIQVEQLIKTAGKRGKLMDMANTNTKISELQLQDVMRNLLFQLRQDYYTQWQLLQTKAINQQQLQQLTGLQAAQKTQWQAGNIAEKDYLRIQAEVLSLQQDIVDVDRNISDIQKELKLLLHLPLGSFVKPVDMPVQTAATLPLDDILSSARQNNPYYLLQQTNELYQQQNLSYQKALRTPDITLTSAYDRNSNYAPNYVGLGFSVPLPLFNKNKGNIKAAEYAVKQQQATTGYAAAALEQDVYAAYQKWSLTVSQDNETFKNFTARYNTMLANMVNSYNNRQIGLLEFLDFFDAYKQSQQRNLQLQLNTALAKAEVNYCAGKDILP